ncbi:MAG TPA: aldehyde dehydrogenase family protein [Chitinophagaceae bacterium]|nr:aldehyde dehydrogenase family protein [Chitinophagaceae bacterium]
MSAESTKKHHYPIEKGKLYINGKFRDASNGKTFDTINPTTEEVVTQIAEATKEDTLEAIAAAKEAFENGPWGKMPGSERSKIMHRIADLIEGKYAEELKHREVIDMGKLYSDVTRIEIPHLANMFRYYAGWTTKLEGAVKPVEGIPGEHLMAWTRREALGVVAAITPFNFPLILTVSKIAPALAAGNCFIHKPASQTPLSAITIAKIMDEAGMPPGAYNLVIGPGETVGNVLTQSPDVDKIAFTGSTKVGQSIVRDSALSMKHTTMELGGKSPNIIFADADIDRAVELSYFAMFWNKSEVCVAGSRLLVEKSIYKEFTNKFIAKVKQAKVGDPFDPASSYGPMSSKGAWQKTLDYIESGKKEGATLATGGNAMTVNGKGYFIEPTVFLDATNEMKISKEEIFGPCLPVIPFNDFDDAIRIANDTPYGLASGVQTRDLKKAIRAANLIKAGTVWTNTWHHYSPSAPFGGYKLSGYGREHGIESFESYTQYKTIWTDLYE